MRIITLVALACLLFLSSPAFAASYTVRVLGAPGTPSTAAGINQAGDVAGQSGGDAWVWHAGTMRFIEDPLVGTVGHVARDWFALGVSTRGDLLAFSTDIDSAQEAIRLDATGPHPLDSLPLGPVAQELHPTASGPAGQIIGWYWLPRSGPPVMAGFVSAGSRLVTIPPPPGQSGFVPRAINAQGWIAGDGFLLRNGTFNDLGPYLPALINDRGNLAGKRIADGSLFVWIGNNSYTIAPLAGHPNLTPLGMNNLGAVVGTAAGANPADTIGFLWTPAGGTESLENASGGAVDLRIVAAHGINDAGQIAADAAGLAVGSPHAVLLTPVAR